ncbi:flagellar biosynthesis protein FlgJ [Azospirillum brasilense]|uniref:Flagellar biosynthesis protein FlgJ n=1 Tax=Azospirillum brasilense TaxID=192 RepID=A0A4D8QGR2_AZOBR|nr:MULTISPECIES: rod-binding protein [Azospirillum]MDW7555028.1 rod-binding protein [Azospirillum brasilense]MDW7594805.1 rod-binding protein [Azospirillum brasilense]MDW7629659.1 rod-binding protein [Azospirillum brasilense]MDX5954519.1 rod-binding protein [Azospirillum brasilense]NUB17088.1 flagellar biosynthesis protein FlgJ [Azospirillum brasilense]
MDTTLSLPGLPPPRLPAAAERAQNGAQPGAQASFRTAVRTDLVDPKSAESKVDPAIRAKIRQSANEFESVFVSQMLGHMFDGIEVDQNFGGGHAEEMFRSMLTNEYGKQVSRSGGFGIADQVYRELLRAQEGNHG